jgi:L-fuculose-phosphate aldolase
MTTLQEVDARILPHDLSPAARFVLLARMLHREGYDDHNAGHISYRQDDGTLIVNPAELSWDELCPSDAMRIDLDGAVLEGRWSVPQAITLHLELHAQQPGTRVAVHNHPRWGTIWADVHRTPPIYDQTSALISDDIALYDEYDGTVVDRSNARRAVAALGTSPAALLANHGVLVVGRSIRQAHVRCVALEWRCRNAWHVEALGGGVQMRPDIVDSLSGLVERTQYPFLFEAMARRELRADPGFLDR